MKIVSVVGARPNFMKIAPIARAIKKHKNIKHVLVHTGQHYDYKMSESFFNQLGIPKPTINLEVGSASHAQQTSQIMSLFENVLLKHKPDIVLVVGDVNSTMACSLVASKLRIAVAHIEGGLRSFDRNMPEEINRLVTDAVADLQFTTSPDADMNLIKEGFPKNRIFFVGNVMIDTLLYNLEKARKTKILSEVNVQKGEYALVTLHRPSNVDSKTSMISIMSALKEVQSHIPVVFPIHPRTRKNLTKFIPEKQINAMKNIRFIDPLPYFDFLNLTSNAKMVLTDSGGIQEETTVLGIPCLTIRENTERPVTIEVGTNTLVGLNKDKIIRESRKILNGKGKKGRRPKYWDGKASERIISKIIDLHKKKRLLR